MSGILANWNKYDHSDPKHRKSLLQALQFFVSLPNKFLNEEFLKSLTDSDREKFKKRHGIFQNSLKYQVEKGHVPTPMELREFATPGDFPAPIIDVIEKFHAVTNYDNGYEQIFDIHDASATKKPGFSVSTVQSGLTFEQILPGEKVEVKQMSGSRIFAYYHYYAGALGWHRQLFDDEEWWTIEDNAIEFNNKAYARRASVFYALLEAAMDLKTCITLQDVGCNDCNEYYIAVARAINQAAVNIMLAVQNKGYGITTGTSLVVLTPLQHMDTIRKALALTIQHYKESEKQINFNLRPITTMMLTNTGRIGVILPNIRLKGGYRMDLTTFTNFDMLSYTDSAAGWMRYGGAVGDLDQIECIDMSGVSGLQGSP